MIRDNYQDESEQIDPQSGTPDYFNINKVNNAPKIDWSEWRRINNSMTPIAEPIGNQFEPFGGFKSADEGITTTGLYDIPEARAKGQSGMRLFGNALGQLAVEAALGVPEAVGYTLDMENLYDADKNAQEGYDNAMSKALRETKEGLQEDLFPIYQSRKAQEGSFSERMSDPTFWAAQGKTFGNTVRLMGVGVGSSILTGGIGGAMVGAVAASLVSAKAEATMEAYQAFTAAKDKYINDPNLLKDQKSPYDSKLNQLVEEAKALQSTIYNPTQEGSKLNEALKQSRLIQIESEYKRIQDLKLQDLDKASNIKAGEEAALVYKANAAILIPSNFIQYATFMKPFAGIAKTIKAAEKTKLGRFAGIGINMASEGIYEEGGQQAAQWEAANSVRNGTGFFGEGFGDRLSEYIKDPEMQTNMAIGALMGLGFDVILHVGNKVKEKYQQVGALKAFAANLKDVDTFNKIDNDIEKDLIVRAVNTDQFDQLKERITAFANDAQNDEKLDDNEKSEIKKKADKLVENATYVQEADAKLVEENKIYAENPNVRKSYVLTKFEDKKTSELIDEFQKRLHTATSKSSIGVDPLTSIKNKVAISQAKINATKIILAKLEADTKLDLKTKNDKINNLNKVIETTTNERDENIAQAVIQDPSFKQDKYTVPNIGEIFATHLQLGGLEIKRDIIRQHLAEYESKTPEQIAKEDAQIEKEKKQNLINIQRDSFTAELSNLTDKDKVAEFNDRIDKSGLESKDKDNLKKQALNNYNSFITRQQQQAENTAQVAPKLIGGNEMPDTQVAPKITTATPKLIESNELPEVDSGDRIDNTPQFIAPKLIDNNDLAVDIPNTTTKVLNDELKTDEVVPMDDDVLNKSVKEEETVLYETEFAKTSASISIAHKDKKSSDGQDIYVDGKIALEDSVNEKLFDPTYANTGTNIVMYVDENYENKDDSEYSYSKKKNDIDNVPIIIVSEDGSTIGYVHTIDWIIKQTNLDPAIQNRLITETKLIRSNFATNGKVDLSKNAKTVITNKSAGWVNLNPMVEVNGKMIRQHNPISEAFKTDNVWDDRVEIMTLTGDDVGNIDTVNDKVFKVLKGKTVVLIPGSNGQVITKVIKQKKLSQATEKVQNEFVHNILGTIYNASYSDISRDELFEEVGKYLHATFKSTAEVSKLTYGNKLDLLFNLDLFEGAGKNVTISIRKPSSQNYDVYKVSQVNGKINISKRVNVKDNIFVEIDPKAFEGILKTTLKNKYLNLSKKDLKNPKGFTRLVADNNYNTTRTEVSDYRDFISDTGAASTSVHGVMLSNGKVTYTTQPTISYDGNLSGSEKVEPTIIEVTKPVPAESTAVRKSRVKPKGKPAKLDSDDIQSLGSSDLELTKTTISSFTLIPNVVQENELVGTLTNMYLAEFSASKELAEKKDQSVLNSILSDITDIYNDATDGIYYEDDAEANAQVAKYSKILLDNFEPQYNEDGTVKFIGYKTKLRLELERLKFDPLEEAEDNRPDDDTQQAQFIDNKNFKEDPEKSASSRIKRGLISIPQYENGEIKTNLIGTEVYRDYYEVFNTLMEATSDININEIKTEIDELGADLTARDGGVGNVYSQVSELLNASFKDDTDTFYNEFMSVFKKQRAKFIKPIIFSNREGLPSINLYNSNKSGASGVLFNKWAEGVKNSPLVNKIKKELSENKGSSKSFNELKSRFDNAEKNFLITDGSYYKEISSIFTSIGFTVSPEAIEKLAITFYKTPNRIADLEIRDNGVLLKKFSSVISRSFSHLINEFNKPESLAHEENEDSDGVENNLFRNQAKYISVLARYETKVNPSVLSSSFRNGNGDVVYGFVNSHHLANTINDIKNDEAKLRNLRQDKFSWASTWLTDENLSEVELFYLDSAVNGASQKSAVAFEDMSALEKEQIKASLVLNKGSRKGYFMTPTPSDKTTFAIISGVRMSLDKNEDLDLSGDTVKLKDSGKLIDTLYDVLVRSEIHRIEETSRLVKEAIKSGDFTNLVKGEHYDIRDGKVVLGSRGYFFLMPQMNEFFKERLNNSLLSDHFVIGKEEVMPNGDVIETTAKKELANQLNRLHEIKSKQWSNLGVNDRIDAHYKQKIKNKIPANYFNSYAALDYVVNSMVGYANQFMMITGDPAVFAKAEKSWDGTHNTWQSMVDGTITNMFKRTAKDIAPGYEGLFDEKDKNYSVLFIEEPERDSRLVSEYEGNLKKQITSTLKNIEFADAQEWTTLEEHVKVLRAIGRITQDQSNRILDKYKSGKDLTDAEMGFVLQPMKPVQVGRKYINGNPVEYYIKTSSFPLIPQLTAGLEIDAVRRFMEKNKIDRLVPQTAVKLGYFNSIQILDKSGMVLLDENGDLAPTGFKVALNDQPSESLHSLDRSFFRIQQDVPYDENKSKTIEGSQMKKMKYSDLDSSWLFDINGSEMHGHELKQLDDDIHTEIYKRNYEAFVKQLGGITTPDGKSILTNFGNLKELLIEEAKERGFDFNDLMLLNTVNNEMGIDGTPLFMHPALPKIEALLNSLIKNKVLVNKFPGKSYVQGSSMGFDYMLSGDKNIVKEVGKKVGVKLLSTFTGELGYKFSEDKKSVVAQVLVPWYFQESMEKFIDKNTGQIDESKIDPKLLELIGYRIPTQDHGSMIIMQVVGFLPKESGDLLIIPPEMSKIMGSDFDVDKLFVHRFNYSEEYGHLSKIIPSSNKVDDLTEKELQNLSLDITRSILSHPEITERLLSPLDNDDVKKVLIELSELRNEETKPNELDPNKINFSKASNTSAAFDNLHSMFVDINAAGKTGVGIGSIASTSHVLAQYAGIYIKSFKINEETWFDSAVKFTDTAEKRKKGESFNEENVDQTSVNSGVRYKNHVSSGLYRLDRVFGITKGKRISQVIKNIQTEAVDNAKNQRLFGMNLNKNTFDTALFLAKAGLDEKYIGYFLNQPIIVDYVNKLNNISDIGSTEFEVGQKEKIQAEVWAKYQSKGRVMPEFLESKNVSLEEMSSAIAGKVDNNVQLDVLESFITYADMANKLSRLFRAINTDTKYLGKSLTSTVIKRDDFTKDFVKLKGFGNHFNMKNTLQLSAHKYGVDGSSSLYNSILPYESEFFKSLRNMLELTSGRDVTEERLDELFSAIKNTMWTTAWADFMQTDNIDIERRRLLFGTETEQSLANRLSEAKNTSKNTLIKLLNVKTSTIKGVPNVIEFPSAGSLEKDFSLKMQQSWMQLYNTNKQLAMDLVSYSMLNGNQRSARDFARFIPIDILINNGVLKSMNKVFKNVAVVDETGEYADILFKQYIQHNPSRAYPGDIGNFSLYDNLNNKSIAIANAQTVILAKGFIEPEVRFVYFYDKTTRSMILFQRDGNKYSRVPLLGNKKSLLTEYNLASPNKASIFVENKAVVAPKVKAEPSIPTPKSDTKRDIAKTYGFETGVTTKYVLNQILKNGRSNGVKNEGLLQLVDFLLTNHGELLNTLNLVAIADNSQFDAKGSNWGEINHATNTVKINFSNITSIDKNNKWGFPASTADEFFVMVLAHELLHKVTKTRPISKELNSLFEKFKADESTIGLTKYKLDASEFISGLFTDKRLQNHLNEMKGIKGKSLLAEIWDAIKRMISGDIQIKEGSLLEESMSEAFKLIAPESKPSFDFKSAVNKGVQLDIGEEFLPDADYGDIDLLNAMLDYNFSEKDMQEANEVDKFCNGSKGKFGKIKK